MADAAQHHCTRAWYFRPPVWIFGVLLLGLAAFGVMEIINRPAAIPYGDFFDQLDAGNVASVTFQGMQVTAISNMPSLRQLRRAPRRRMSSAAKSRILAIRHCCPNCARSTS